MDPIRPALWIAAGVSVAWLVAGDELTERDLTPTEAANLQAFLDVIAEGEGGPEGYHALVYGGRFENFEDHPYNTGEFPGVRRPDGRLTTAAGRYQITRTTWQDIGGRKRFGSFMPEAQDRAAVYLMRRRGALPHVIAGEPEKAAYALRDEWEMFRQPQWTADAVAARFASLGGILMQGDAA